MSKLMNNSRIRKLNWKTEINLENGLKDVYLIIKIIKVINFNPFKL